MVKILKRYDKRIIIENNPKMGLNDKICFGYFYSQLEFIGEKCGLNICLDIGHAIKSAVSQKMDYKKYLEALIRRLRQNYFHISDGLLNNEKDEHLAIREGEYDFNFLAERIKENHTKYISLETPRTNLNSLKEDSENIKRLKSILLLQKPF